MARKSKDLITLENKMASDIEAYSSRVTLASESNNVTIDGGSFVLGNTDLGDSLSVVIVDFSCEKVYYETAYSEGSSTSPTCYAVGVVNPKNLVPADNVEDPQYEQCDGCEHNEWGSSGRGKACSDKRRLLIVDFEDITEDPEIAMLKVPKASVSAFDQYINGLHKVHKIPCYKAITRISFDENLSYPKLEFEMENEIENIEILKLLISLQEENENLLTKGYSPSSEKADFNESGFKKKVAKKKVAKKKVAKKKASLRKTVSKFA